MNGQLIDMIHHAIATGHTVSFKQEGLNMSVRITKKKDDEGISTVKVSTQFLPIRTDHMTEEKIAHTIQFMLNKINQK